MQRLVCAKALRQEPAWQVGGTARRLLWPKRRALGGRSEGNGAGGGPGGYCAFQVTPSQTSSFVFLLGSSPEQHRPFRGTPDSSTMPGTSEVMTD